MTGKILKIVAFAILLLFFHENTFALTNGPTQQDFQSFEPVDVTDLVNLSTGDFSYVLPLGEVRGPTGVGYPLALHYHAGIKHEQEATHVGLGWNLNVGAINRQVIGFPDDIYQGNTISYLYDPGEYNYFEELSVGWAGFNINVGMSDKGFEGITGIGLAYNKWLVGINFDFRNNGAGVNVGGLSVWANENGGGVGVGLTTQNGVGLNASIAFDKNGKPSYAGSVGLQTKAGNFSLGISGDQGTASGPADVNTSSRTFSDGGFFSFYNHRGWGFVIPYVWVSIGYSFDEWGWHYAELQTNSTYGYLYHSAGLQRNVDTYNNLLPEYLSRSGNEWDYNSTTPALAKTTATSGEYNTVIGNEKLEYVKKDDFNLPSQDMYSITGQGINGVFKPFSNSALQTCHAYENEYDGDYSSMSSEAVVDDAFNKNIMKFSPIFKDGIVFKMLGEASYNMIDKHAVSGYTEADPYQNLDEISGASGRVQGTRIEPLFNLEGSKYTKLDGFTITNESGVTYFYTLPLNSRQMAVFSNNIPQYPASLDPGFGYSYTLENEDYATTWLLTAITGPDYVKVDLGESGLISEEKLLPRDGDFGYWVRFRYAYDADKRTAVFPWRNPYKGFIETQEPVKRESGWKLESRYTSSLGKKDITYLKSIETAGEVAYFQTSDRNDCKGIKDGEYPDFGIDFFLEKIKANNPFKGALFTVPGGKRAYVIMAPINPPDHRMTFLFPASRYSMEWYNSFSSGEIIFKYIVRIDCGDGNIRKGTLIVCKDHNLNQIPADCEINYCSAFPGCCQVNKLPARGATIDNSDPNNPMLKIDVGFYSVGDKASGVTIETTLEPM